MRLPSYMLAAVVLLTPALAYSQPVSYPGNSGRHPVIYVCTAAAQVVQITTNISGGVASATVIATGSGEFDDCVLGPDGWLYIANIKDIVKVDPQNPASPVTVATLTSRARGLAFNVNRLYVTTDELGVFAIDTTASTPTAEFQVAATSARGIAFDVAGNLDFAAGGQILQAPGEPYNNDYDLLATEPLGTVAGAYDVGFNTCREIVVGSTTSRTIQRLTNSGPASTNISFPSQYRPLAFEIDWSNRIYMLAGTADDGSKARIMVASPNVGGNATGTDWLTTCGNFSVSTLLELKTSGSGSVPELLSNKAVGLAIGQSAHMLKAVLTTSVCDAKLDFGYHIYETTGACAPPGVGQFTLEVTAYKSRPADVAFSGTVPSGAVPVSYSPSGGFATELTFAPTVPVILAQDPLNQYYAFSQQPIAHAGIADDEDTTLGPNVPYNNDVGTDFWDVGLLDWGGGDRERDWSKRVVYSAGTVDCVLGAFAQPLFGDLPLINNASVLPIGIECSGPDCASLDKQMRVSIARINKNALGIPTSFTPRPVMSNVQESNKMDFKNGKFVYNLLMTSLEDDPLEPGAVLEYLLTVNGPAGNKSVRFTVTK